MIRLLWCWLTGKVLRLELRDQIGWYRLTKVRIEQSWMGQDVIVLEFEHAESLREKFWKQVGHNR